MQDMRPGKVSVQKSCRKEILGNFVTFEELLNTGENSTAYAISAGKLQAFNDLSSNAKAGAKQETYGGEKVKKVKIFHEEFESHDIPPLPPPFFTFQRLPLRKPEKTPGSQRSVLVTYWGFPSQ